MYQGLQLRHAWPNASTADGADLITLIKERRSICRYRKKKLDAGQVDLLIEAATYAPSAHNAQPWRFFVISDQAKKTRLAEEMAARFRRDMERDRVPEKTINRKVQRSVRVFGSAPVLVIAAVDMAPMEKYPDAARQQAEMTMATQSLAAAIENLLLAARAMGLGGCWYCAPLFCPAVVKAALAFPASVLPQALITLGYPAESPPAPPRLKLDEVRSVR